MSRAPKSQALAAAGVWLPRQLPVHDPALEAELAAPLPGGPTLAWPAARALHERIVASLEGRHVPPPGVQATAAEQALRRLAAQVVQAVDRGEAIDASLLARLRAASVPPAVASPDDPH